jgi:chloride channel protein, CIC family
MRRSILTEKVARRGHHLAREDRVDPLTLTRVQQVMVTEVQTLPATMTLHEAAAFLTEPTTRHPSFPVVDGEGRVLGIVNPPTVLGWRRAGRGRRMVLGELLAGQRVVTAFPDEYLEAIVDRMMVTNVAQIPVVSREDGRLVGYLGWRDILLVRSRAQEEERQRVVFYRVR